MYLIFIVKSFTFTFASIPQQPKGKDKKEKKRKYALIHELTYCKTLTIPSTFFQNHHLRIQVHARTSDCWYDHDRGHVDDGDDDDHLGRGHDYGCERTHARYQRHSRLFADQVPHAPIESQEFALDGCAGCRRRAPRGGGRLPTRIVSMRYDDEEEKEEERVKAEERHETEGFGNCYKLFLYRDLR